MKTIKGRKQVETFKILPIFYPIIFPESRSLYGHRQVPEELRVPGLVVSFLNEANKVEKWEFQGEKFTLIKNWVSVPNRDEVIGIVENHPYNEPTELLKDVAWTGGHIAWEGAPEDMWTELIPVTGMSWLVFDVNAGGYSKHAITIYDSKKQLLTTINETRRDGTPYYIDCKVAYIQVCQVKGWKPFAKIYAFNTYNDAIRFVNPDNYNKVSIPWMKNKSFNASGVRQNGLFGNVFDVQKGDTLIVIYKNNTYMSSASGRINFLTEDNLCIKSVAGDANIGVMYEYLIEDERIVKVAFNYYEGNLTTSNIDEVRAWGIYVYIEREIRKEPYIMSYIDKIRNKKYSFIPNSIDISDFPFTLNDKVLTTEGEFFLIDGSSAGRIAIRNAETLHKYLISKSMDYVVPRMDYKNAYCGFSYSFECLVTNTSGNNITLANNILDYEIVQPNAEVKYFNAESTEYGIGNNNLFVLEFPKASLKFRRPKVHLVNLSMMDKFKSNMQNKPNVIYKVPFRETEETVPYARYAKGIPPMSIKPKMVFFGDSTMVSNTVSVPLLLAKRYNFELVDCSQWGSVPLQIEGAEGAWELSDEKLAKVDSSTGLVVIQGGLNWGGQVNQGKYEDGTEDSRDRKTLYGCINYAVDDILKKSPDCIIVLCTVQTSFYTTGQGVLGAPGTVKRWNDVYRNIAAKRHLVLADLANSLIPTVENRTVFYNDEVHPKITACLRWAACINSELQKVLF